MLVSVSTISHEIVIHIIGVSLTTKKQKNLPKKYDKK